MIERLGPGEEPRVEAFLVRHAATSMFLRSNLRRSGLEDAPRAFHGCWVAAVEGGEIVGVVVHAWNGGLLLQAPGRAAEVALAAVATSGRAVSAIIGPWDQATAVRDALPGDAPPRMNSREDLFDLALADLRVPEPLADGRWRCRLAEEGDLELMTRWRYDYCVEAMNMRPGPELESDSRGTLARGIRDGNWFVLEDGGTVAMCAFNAKLPDCVQIGGVWTPPALRGRGYARAAVAGSLLAARDQGVARSILFTDEGNEPARRAYLGLGYRIVGDYGIVLL